MLNDRERVATPNQSVLNPDFFSVAALSHQKVTVTLIVKMRPVPAKPRVARTIQRAERVQSRANGNVALRLQMKSDEPIEEYSHTLSSPAAVESN